MKKTKQTVITKKVTREEAEDHLAQAAICAGKLKVIEGKIAQEEVAIREKYDDNIINLNAERAKHDIYLRAYADQNPDLFGERKSIDMNHGKIGFRTGTPKLKVLSRKWNWETILDQVEKLLPDFVRTKKEVDKEGLINARFDEKVCTKFEKCGICVDQDETFYVDLKEVEVTA